MLEHLHIRNLALIEDMKLEFDEGLNVLTGETGAGKSFILKALSFVMGEKLNSDIVRPDAEKAQVEAVFKVDEKEMIFRRELFANTGRSRFYINDNISSQESIKNLKQSLISHTSQHAQQQLLNPVFQTAILEAKLNAPELIEKKVKVLHQLKDTDEKVKAILEKQSEFISKRELYEMQIIEIDKVSPKPNEETQLEKQKAEWKAQENIRKNYTKLNSILHDHEDSGLINQITNLEYLVKNMNEDIPNLKDEIETISEFRQFLIGFANTIPRSSANSKKIDIDGIEERLFAIAQLKRKLKRNLDQILSLKEELQENISFIDLCKLDISKLNREKEKLKNDLKDIIEKLSPLKHRSANAVAAILEENLKDLGFSEHVQVLPQFLETEIWPGIMEERGRIYWAPNPGQNLQPLEKIASGGELSRFLLALTALGKQNKDLTYIFDEVDAGVGGLTLNKVAEKLKNLAKNHQILLITHWPQLALDARKHFFISKIIKDNKTYTKCKPLKYNEIKNELQRMAGGNNNFLI